MRKLYLFMKAEYLISNLEKDEIKVILPDGCNDPFEFTPAKIEGHEAHDTDGVGMICLSEDYSSSTMWAHYADKHKGVCLEFAFPEIETSSAVYSSAEDEQKAEYFSDISIIDVPEKKQYTKLPVSFGETDARYIALMMKVLYHPKRAYPAQIQVRCVLSSKDLTDARYSRLYAAKGQEWSYEKEWRLFVSLDECLSYHDGCYFVKGLTKYISRILLGQKCSLRSKVVQNIADKNGLSARCVKMLFSDNLFSVYTEDEPQSSPQWQPYLSFSADEWHIMTEMLKEKYGLDRIRQQGYNKLIHDFLLEHSQH